MDIRITSDGMIDLSTGDLAMTSTSEFVAQKLYRALVAMPSNIIAGKQTKSYTALQAMIRSFLQNYFAGDKNIIAANISVDMSSDTDSSSAYITLSYKGNDENGDVSATQGMSYAIHDGTVEGIAFDRTTFNGFASTSNIEVTVPLVVEDVTSYIIIPIMPANDALTGGTRIVIRTETDKRTTEMSTYPFLINTTSRPRTYTVQNYLTSRLPAGMTLIRADVANATVDYEQSDELGAITISADKAGIIEGTVCAINCDYLCTAYDIFETHIESPAYPLSPLRGRYRAFCSKPIPPGRYMVQYTGIIPE